MKVFVLLELRRDGVLDVDTLISPAYNLLNEFRPAATDIQMLQMLHLLLAAADAKMDAF